MSEAKQEQKQKAPIDFSHIGGTRVGHPVPVKLEKPIDFSSIGSRCVRKSSDHLTVKAAPDKPPKDARE